MNNQKVSYSLDSSVGQLANQLLASSYNSQEYLNQAYNFVSSTIVYAVNKTLTAKPYYISNLTKTLEVKSGICTDYATLLTALLRLNSVPSRMVTGTVNGRAHAWVEVYFPNRDSP